MLLPKKHFLHKPLNISVAILPIMPNDTKLIMERLDEIKLELGEIKETILDISLTKEELELLNKAETDLREGKTKRLK